MKLTELGTKLDATTTGDDGKTDTGGISNEESGGGTTVMVSNDVDGTVTGKSHELTITIDVWSGTVIKLTVLGTSVTKTTTGEYGNTLGIEMVDNTGIVGIVPIDDDGIFDGTS